MVRLEFRQRNSANYSNSTNSIDIYRVNQVRWKQWSRWVSFFLLDREMADTKSSLWTRGIGEIIHHRIDRSIFLYNLPRATLHTFIGRSFFSNAKKKKKKPNLQITATISQGLKKKTRFCKFGIFFLLTISTIHESSRYERKVVHVSRRYYGAASRQRTLYRESPFFFASFLPSPPRPPSPFSRAAIPLFSLLSSVLLFIIFISLFLSSFPPRIARDAHDYRCRKPTIHWCTTLSTFSPPPLWTARLQPVQPWYIPFQFQDRYISRHLLAHRLARNSFIFANNNNNVSVRARASASEGLERRREKEKEIGEVIWNGTFSFPAKLARYFLFYWRKNTRRAQPLGRHRQRWLPTERGTSRTVRRKSVSLYGWKIIITSNSMNER